MITKSAKMLFVLSIVIMLTVFVPFLYWGQFKDIRVPCHFNLTGMPDGWGGRWVFILLAAIAVVLFIILSYCYFHPDKLNYPVKISKDRKCELYSAGKALALRCNVVVMAICSFFANTALSIALGINDRMINWLFYVLICALIVVLLLFMWSIWNKRSETN